MNKPTEEQKKELWEWCGLRTQYIDEVQAWYDPGSYGKEVKYGKIIGTGFWPWSLPIDLNNLFKYAVPKLANYSMYKGLEPGVPVFGQHIAKVWSLTHGYGEAYSEDPALALFEAIYEVIHEKD